MEKKAAKEDTIPNEAWIYAVKEITSAWNGIERLSDVWITGIVTTIYNKTDSHIRKLGTNNSQECRQQSLRRNTKEETGKANRTKENHA